MNTQEIVLSLLFSTQDVSQLDRLDSKMFDGKNRQIFSKISDYYRNYSKIPSRDSLIMYLSRQEEIQVLVECLPVFESEIDLSIAIDTLEAEYAQVVALNHLRDYVEELCTMEMPEIVPRLSDIAVKMEEEFMRSDSISTGREIPLFTTTEQANLNKVTLGISQRWDTVYPATRQQYILVGGYRGAGKSVLSVNMATAQFQMGNICPYFTIEMDKYEVNARMYASMALIDEADFRNHRLSAAERNKLMLTRALVFEGGLELLESKESLNTVEELIELENELRKLPMKNDMVIYDDRALKLTTVDVQLSMLVSKYEARVTSAVVDYVNVLSTGNSRDDQLDWKVQLGKSTALKNLARKHNILLVAPIQVDKSGEARLSKGILDSADKVFNIEKSGDLIKLKNSKSRGDSETDFHFKMKWDSVAILYDIVPEVSEDDSKDGQA